MKHIKYLLVILVVATFFIAGCGGSGSHASKQSLHVQDWHVEVIPYNGHSLTCVVHQVNSGSHSAWGGPSCDWPEYHHEFGWDKNR